MSVWHPLWVSFRRSERNSSSKRKTKIMNSVSCGNVCLASAMSQPRSKRKEFNVDEKNKVNEFSFLRKYLFGFRDESASIEASGIHRRREKHFKRRKKNEFDSKALKFLRRRNNKINVIGSPRKRLFCFRSELARFWRNLISFTWPVFFTLIRISRPHVKNWGHFSAF